MDEVNIRFGASIDDLRTKLGEVVQMFKGISEGAASELASKAASSFGVFGKGAEEAAQKVVEGWQDLPPVFRAVSGALLALGAVIGTGLFVKKFADDNAEMVEATRDFARALGISTNEASVMKAALDDVGASTSEYEGAAKGLARQLRTKEEAMQKAGLATRDAAGNFRPLNDLMLDGIKVLGEYKEGTDRNLASQAIFGRGIDASSRLMLLNHQVVEDNRKAVDELSLSVGESSVEAWKDYDAASDRAGLTMQAFGKAIAESVLPVATELTEWFNNVAPAAILVIRGALGGLTTAFLGLTNGVRVVWEVINAMVITVAEPIIGLTTAISRAITGDFAGAAAAIKGSISTIGDAWSTAGDKITASSEKTRARIGQVWAFATGGNDAPGDSGSPAGTRNAPPGKPKKEKAAKDSGEGKVDAAELALEKAVAEGSLAVLNEYLKQDKALNEEAYRDHLISAQEFFDRKLAIELQGNQQSAEAKQAELAAAEAAEAAARERMAGAKTVQEGNKAEADALKAQAEQVKLLSAINVLEAQRSELIRRNGVERAEAERKLRDELMMIGATQDKAGVDAGIGQEKAELDAMKQLRQVSAEEAFAAERSFEQRSFAATQAFLAAKRSLIRGDDQRAIAQANAEELSAERQHQARMLQIEREANVERRRAGVEFAGSVQSNFASMLASVMQGTARMSDAIRAFGVQVGKMFTDLIAKKFTEQIFNATGLNKAIEKAVTFVTQGIAQIVQQWVLGQSLQTSATAAGAAARTGIEAGAAATSKSITIGDAIMSIGAKAWQAAAAVFASIAAIPYVGPFLAPAAAIAASAVVLGFIGRVASSEGGDMQVGQDRLNFVHKDETILPAGFASGLRGLVGEGGQSPLSIQVGNILGAINSTQSPGPGAWSTPNIGPSRFAPPPAISGGGASISASQRNGGGGKVIGFRGIPAGDFIVAHRKEFTRLLRNIDRDFSK
jgi:hypothetical protein